jgi:hypothetical protein
MPPLLAIIAISVEQQQRQQGLEAVREWIRSNPQLWQACRYRYRPPLRYSLSIPFSLDDYDDTRAHEFMRFTVSEIWEFLPYLRLDKCPYCQRLNPDPELAIGFVLWRLAWPHRYKDIGDRFGRSNSWMLIVYNDVLVYLAKRFQSLLYWDTRRITMANIRRWEAAVLQKNKIHAIWGFVDGTIRPICRPSTIDQRFWYTGYKKLHGIKFQAISTPDGLISSLDGAYLASLGDWALWHDSEVEYRLRSLFEGITDHEIPLIYGDPAYTRAYGVIGAYTRKPHCQLTDDQNSFNYRMSTARITIEQLFGHNLRLWGQNSFKNAQHIGNSLVAPPYIVGVLLTNIQACLRGGNQVSAYFDCLPPSLEEYLKSIVQADTSGVQLSNFNHFNI